MNYQERISALETFKSAISGGEIVDSTASFTSDISGWACGETAKTGYNLYVERVKTDVAKITTKKQDFISKIDSRISSIQAQFDFDYMFHKTQLNAILDKDTNKMKEKKQNYCNSTSMDSSVRAKLIQNIY